ncbi:hypothetical protein CJ030_MR4G004745 [Morella rubra]|uniref:Secreted protein n=1 Tax=Morella rubra TaxID=262757 RepID=A0A6A1VUW3_9ROSI|nr:hypothetical protein CJ030_MR4G004745 [Morella rubra]
MALFSLKLATLLQLTDVILKGDCQVVEGRINTDTQLYTTRAMANGPHCSILCLSLTSCKQKVEAAFLTTQGASRREQPRRPQSKLDTLHRRRCHPSPNAISGRQRLAIVDGRGRSSQKTCGHAAITTKLRRWKTVAEELLRRLTLLLPTEAVGEEARFSCSVRWLFNLRFFAPPLILLIRTALISQDQVVQRR